MDPVALKVPVAGSYNSADEKYVADPGATV
jgi:hypothetical protein